MTLQLERIWAYQIDAGNKPPFGKEQDATQAWAQDFIDYYENLEDENCMPVDFIPTEYDENGNSKPNLVAEHMRIICYESNNANDEVEKLVNRLDKLVNHSVGDTLNIITLLCDADNPAEKIIVTWTYPSSAGYEMDSKGDLTAIERIYVQKKLLRKAGAFPMTPTIARRGKIYDHTARYNFNRGAKYWREYLLCVSAVTNLVGTDSLKNSIQETMRTTATARENVELFGLIERLKDEKNVITLSDIWDTLSPELGKKLDKITTENIPRDAPFTIEQTEFRNYFNYIVYTTDKGITVIKKMTDDNDGLESKFDDSGKHLIAMPLQTVNSTKTRKQNV